MTKAPRVDQLRNSVDGTMRLLKQVAAGVATLHDLAYDRQVADEVRVRGGEPDYALDNHGDPRAREAYKELAVALYETCGTLNARTQRALRILNSGDTAGLNRQHPATTTVLEHAEAITAQTRRVARGEFDAGRTHPQTGSGRAMGALQAQVSKLRARNAELEAVIDAESQRIIALLGDTTKDEARKRRLIRRAAERLAAATANEGTPQ